MEDTNSRSCTVDDLRLNADMRVDAAGKPLPADMTALAADPAEYFEPDNTGGMGAFWWCANQSCPQIDVMYYSFSNAVAHVYGFPLMYEDASGAKWYAGVPHRGRVGDVERRIVQAHLAEVNAMLAAAGLRQIDPTNAKHAARYGL
jgi:hypothetical protein